MELRSCSHLHFIQAVKGESVIKILNVGSRGRPALTLKKIEDIYVAEDAKNHDSIPASRLKDESEGLTFDCDMVKVESPCLPMAERTLKSDPETSVFNCRDGDDGRKSDVDDMTLKQIKERCKSKKRKLSKYGDSSDNTVGTCSPVKQDYSNLHPEEDEFDLKEPLSSWKSKLSKNTKGKRKRLKNHVAISSQSAITIVKSEQILNDQDFLHSSEDLPAPIDIKVEVCEPDYLDCHTIICVSSDSSFGCDEQVGSSGIISSEAPERANECFLETGMSTPPRKELQCCVVNEMSYEYMEHMDCNSALDVGFAGGEVINVDSQEITCHRFAELSESGFKKDGYITHQLPHKISLETVSTTNFSVITPHNSDIYDNSENYYSMHDMSCNTSRNSQVQLPDMAVNHNLNCEGLCDGGRPFLIEDGNKDDLPSPLKASTLRSCNDCSSSWNSNSCLSPDSCLVSDTDDSPSFKEKQSLLSACADAATNCSGAIHSCDATDKLIPAGVRDYNHSELQHLPERLLSTRKTISPSSQERLCKAMKSIELHDNEHYKCRGKLFSEEQTENKVISTEGPDQIRSAGMITNLKQSYRKPKHDRKGSIPKGTLKVPHFPRAAPRFSTGCTSIESCSESAIAFSQRQMQDIECLATKLTKELKSMKDIVKGTLPSEACPSTSLKHNRNEWQVRKAIEKATRLEESATRWLSMMSRDCNRFCKIMRLTGKDSAASENVVHKERKKITFADEAGGKLCSVKVFQDDMASPLESSNDKQELLGE